MSSAEFWTRASLRISASKLSVAELESKLARASDASSDEFWLADLEITSDDAIDAVLTTVGEFLSHNQEVLVEIAAVSDIELRIGWMPVSGLAGVLFERTFIELLARLNAQLALDIYERDDN